MTATYLGVGRWTVGTSRATSTADMNRFDNSAVSAEVRTALQLADALPPDTRIEVRAEHIRHGVIANNTFPTAAWWFDIDPGASGVAPDLDAAIWECLVALRLSPSRAAARRPPFLDASFGADALTAATQPVAWAAELTRCAREWFGADAAIADAYDFMSQLRALGHPLHSFDESDDFVTWSTGGTQPPRRRLDVDVRLPAYATAVVVVTVQENDNSPPGSGRPNEQP